MKAYVWNLLVGLCIIFSPASTKALTLEQFRALLAVAHPHLTDNDRLLITAVITSAGCPTHGHFNVGVIKKAKIGLHLSILADHHKKNMPLVQAIECVRTIISCAKGIGYAEDIQTGLPAEACGICQFEPVCVLRLSCSHSFCAECILKSFASRPASRPGVHHACPMCRQPLGTVLETFLKSFAGYEVLIAENAVRAHEEHCRELLEEQAQSDSAFITEAFDETELAEARRIQEEFDRRQQEEQANDVQHEETTADERGWSSDSGDDSDIPALVPLAIQLQLPPFVGPDTDVATDVQDEQACLADPD